MKQLFFLASAFLVFQSCNKCSECHYDKGGDEVEIGEYCEDDLEAIEKSGFYETATDSTYEVHCNEH
ncbi:MAG: hypothetical protein AB8B72_02630 [Crocinitomicaceae bacterium]